VPAPVINISLRFTPPRDSLRVTYPTGGGATTVSMTGAGLMLDAAAIAAAIQVDLIAQVDPGFTCTVSGRQFTIAHASPFDLTPGLRPSLDTAMGLTAGATNVTSVTGVNSPLIYEATLPWSSTTSVTRRLKRWRGGHQQGRSVELSKLRRWHVRAPVDGGDELGQFDQALMQLAKGMPFTWYRDGSTASAWSLTNWWGKEVCMLDTSSREWAGSWRGHPAQVLTDVDLVFVEYVA